MTLINYLNRVHFADSVLEDALWGELDRRPASPILLLTDDDQSTPDLLERVQASIPRRNTVLLQQVTSQIPSEADVARLAEVYRSADCAAIVACGSGEIMTLAKVVRLAISQSRPLSDLSASEGGALRITGELPDMIAVPLIDGVIEGSSGTAKTDLNTGRRIDLSSDKLIPTVTICDPTLISEAHPEKLANACVVAATRCIEALISPNYNPPASGIALDGLVRAMKCLGGRADNKNGELGREAMAACINASLVQQKGCGLAYAIADTLERETNVPFDRGDLFRFLMPELLDCYSRLANPGLTNLNEPLGVTAGGSASETLKKRFSPALSGLHDLGFSTDALIAVAYKSARHRALRNAPQSASPELILTLLEAVY